MLLQDSKVKTQTGEDETFLISGTLVVGNNPFNCQKQPSWSN